MSKFQALTHMMTPNYESTGKTEPPDSVKPDLPKTAFIVKWHKNKGISAQYVANQFTMVNHCIYTIKSRCTKTGMTH